VAAEMDDFGGKLRQARERRGISLRQIAASTKIAAAALDALERNDISKLPGGIFSRAFVRSYAIEVGLDPDETVREFLQRFDQDPAPTAAAVAAEIPEQERLFEQQQRKAAHALMFAAILLPVLAVAAYFALRGRSATPPRATATQSASVPPADTPPAPAPLPDTGAPSAPVDQLKVDLHPTADCWVSLTVDGRKIFARKMLAGQHEAFAMQREAIIEVGNAGVFAFTVNGRQGKPLGEQGQVKTLTLTRANFNQYVR
jgi:cytoskeleton protein RodZ